MVWPECLQAKRPVFSPVAAVRYQPFSQQDPQPTGKPYWLRISRFTRSTCVIRGVFPSIAQAFRCWRQIVDFRAVEGRSLCLANRGRIAEGSGRLQKSVTADYPAQGSSHPDRRLESGAVLATPGQDLSRRWRCERNPTPSPGAIAKQNSDEKGGPGQKDPEQHGRNGWIQDEGIFTALVFRLARNRRGSRINWPENCAACRQRRCAGSGVHGSRCSIAILQGYRDDGFRYWTIGTANTAGGIGIPLGAGRHVAGAPVTMNKIQTP